MSWRRDTGSRLELLLFSPVGDRSGAGLSGFCAFDFVKVVAEFGSLLIGERLHFGDDFGVLVGEVVGLCDVNFKVVELKIALLHDVIPGMAVVGG